MSNTIHPTAVVSEQARLGSGNRIGPFVVIEDDVEMGNDNTFYTGAVVRSGSRLGDGNRLHEHAVLGGEPQDLGFDPTLQTFAILGSGNVLRESVTVHRASKEKMATRLGDNNYLMAQAHIAHDCLLGNNVVLAPNAAIGGFVSVDDRAFISGGVMVHQFARVGRLAMIGGNTKLTQDALPFMITDGVPGEVRGLNLVGLKRAGYTLEDIRVLKQAYKLLFRSGLALQEIVTQLHALGSAHADHLSDFIADSKRSFHRSRE